MFEFIDNDPDTAPATNRHKTPGQVRFDERGNAIYEWRDTKLEEDSQHAERMRERALFNPSLSLVDESPAPDQPCVRNDKGARMGYNPYQSGQLVGRPKTEKKRDMRELSKWIETKRRLAAQTNSTVAEE